MQRIPLDTLASAPAVAALVALLATPHAAGQLTVGPAGSGAQFTEISAAVVAAQPGDVVLVAPGTYGAFLVDKAVTIVGAGHDLVVVDRARASRACASPASPRTRRRTSPA